MSFSLKRKLLIIAVALAGIIVIYISGIIRSMASDNPAERTLHLDGGVATAAAWSSEGQKLVTYGNYGQNIEVWDKDGNRITTMNRTGLDIPYIYDSVAFIDNDLSLVTPPEGALLQNQYLALSVWDVESGKVIKNIDGLMPGSSWRDNWAWLFAESANQKFIAILTRTNQSVTVFPIPSFEQPVVLRLRPKDLPSIMAVTISPDGSFVALGCASGQVSVYDAKTGHFSYAIQAYNENLDMGVQSLAFSPDGTEIATGAGAGIASTNDATPVRVWSTKDGRLVRAFEEPNLQPIRTLKWSPTGEYIGFGAIDDKLRLWNQITDQKNSVSLSTRGSLCQAFSPDGKALAFCDGNNVRIIKIVD